MKKIARWIVLAVVFVCLMSVSTMAAVVADGECGESLWWQIEDSTLTIYGLGDMYDYGTGWGPWVPASASLSADLAPWTNYASSIQKIVVDDGVTSIGDAAFYTCDKFKNLTLSIPKTVTKIGEEIFFDQCTLTDIYYAGSQADWDKISIGSLGNSHFNNAELHCAIVKSEAVITVKTDTKNGEDYELLFEVTDTKPINGIFVLALYKEGRMVQSQAFPITDTNTTSEVNMSMSTDRATDSYKVFYFENSGALKPLAAAVGDLF